MIITGIDASVNGTGCCKLTLGDDLDIIKREYFTFTSTKKYQSENILHFNKTQFDTYIDKHIFMYKHIIDFCKDSDYVIFEDYALGGIGKVFDIAEFTGGLKKMIYMENIPMRFIEPTVLKKFTYGTPPKREKGAKKLDSKYYMEQEYLKHDILNISHLIPHKTSPKSDIIDSYYLSKFLQLELKLRKGLILLKDLPIAHIELFNRVTKAHPINILVRPFLQRSKEDTYE
jgi:hypothetical protein